MTVFNYGVETLWSTLSFNLFFFLKYTETLVKDKCKVTIYISYETKWQKLILEKYIWMYLISEHTYVFVNYGILNEKEMTIIE